MYLFWPRKSKTAALGRDADVLHERPGPQCQVSLSGRITIDSSPDLRALLLQRLETPKCKSLTVDLHDVIYIDTSGLAILLEVLKAAHAQGKTVHLSRLRERPRYLLETTRLLHLFDEVSPQDPHAERLQVGSPP